MFALIQKTQELYGEQFANCGTKLGNHGVLTARILRLCLFFCELLGLSELDLALCMTV